MKPDPILVIGGATLPPEAARDAVPEMAFGHLVPTGERLCTPVFARLP